MLASPDCRNRDVAAAASRHRRRRPLAAWPQSSPPNVCTALAVGSRGLPTISAGFESRITTQPHRQRAEGRASARGTQSRYGFGGENQHRGRTETKEDAFPRRECWQSNLQWAGTDARTPAEETAAEGAQRGRPETDHDPHRH
jgi:hypothetical protein